MILSRHIVDSPIDRVWILLALVAACIVVTPTTALILNNLSPIESVFFRTRLEGIEAAIQTKYKSPLDSSRKNDNNECPKTFIFPGAGGVDALVEELCSVTPNSLIVDWSDYRGSLITAAYDGEAVGQGIASLLLSESNKEDLHFIGISVGAFAANAAATVLYQEQQQQRYRTKDDKNKPTTIKLTLLDPFCGRGIFGNSYGKENFGKYASTAIQILNTDDPVPTTNDPLPYCYCLDVTYAPQRNTFILLPGDTMHSWPLAYMARHYKEPTDGVVPGTVIKITS